VDFNKFHPNAFLSCSADWTIKLWDKNIPSSLCSWDLNNAVCDGIDFPAVDLDFHTDSTLPYETYGRDRY